MSEKKYPIGGYAPGSYHCHCATCGGGFVGDKRSYQCEPCALNDRAKFDALSPAEQEALVKKNAAAIQEALKDWGKKPDLNPAIIGHGPVWVKASTRLPSLSGEYHSKKHGKRFVMLFAEADHKMPIEYWKGVEWLDESPAEQPVVSKLLTSYEKFFKECWPRLIDREVTDVREINSAWEVHKRREGLMKAEQPVREVEQDFIEFIQNERDAISKEMLSDTWWLEIPAAKRVVFENILIVYDQMVERFKKEK